jgi:hypothetical protein
MAKIKTVEDWINERDRLWDKLNCTSVYKTDKRNRIHDEIGLHHHNYPEFEQEWDEMGMEKLN